MRMTLLVSSTVTVLIWFLVPYLVELVIGEKWESIIPLVRILVLAGLVRSVSALGGALFQASNRPDLDFKMNVPRVLVVVVLIWPLSAYWGLEGACFVVLLAISSTLPVWFYGLKRIAGLSIMDVVRANALTLVSSAVLVVASIILQRLTGPGWLGLSGSLGGSLAIWFAAMWLVGKLTPLDFIGEVRRLKSTIKK
jgi:PST family polysaccharide transporter/lipopolysaccharide exporter